MSVDEKGTIPFAEPCGGCGQVWADRRCFGCHHETGARAATSPAADLVDRLEDAATWVEGIRKPGRELGMMGVSARLREAAQALRHQSTGVTEEMAKAAQSEFASTFRALLLHGVPNDEAVADAWKAALTAALSAQERG